MYYREVILEDDKTLADSGTETFDINILEPITELLLKFKVKNDTAVAKDVPPDQAISKIELVDGGTTYLSMTGQEAMAIAAYEKRYYPPHWYVERLSSNQRVTIPLQFGRYLGDPEFAFDPTRLRNPQLKFTWAKNALHLTGSVSLGIIAKVMEGVAAPSKCLLTKAVETWTGAASGVKVVDLWSDYPYRRLFIRSYLTLTLLTTMLSHFKLTCDADRLVIFDVDSEEFEDILRAMFPPFLIKKYDYLAAGDNFRETWIAGRTFVCNTVEEAGYYAQTWCSGSPYYQGRRSNYDGHAAATGHIEAFCHGEFPQNMYCYQFGRPDDPATWFNAPGFKDIDLKLTEGGLAANSVLLQQPRSLP